MSDNVQHSVIITGVPPAPGSAQPTARPIEELVRDEKQFALYVQVTDLMMKTKPTDLLSWFQVSGIHGAPRRPWDNVSGLSNSSSLGYCTHESVLFPTWHRPYVLLFEQALVGCAVKIALRYTGADAGEWMQAAVSIPMRWLTDHEHHDLLRQASSRCQNLRSVTFPCNVQYKSSPDAPNGWEIVRESFAHDFAAWLDDDDPYFSF